MTTDSPATEQLTAGAADAPVLPAGYEDVPHNAVRLRPRRRAIARNLEAAARIPSLTADVQIDLTALLAARANWNSQEGRAAEDRLSVMAFIARAAVDALAEFPQLNATYTERAMLMWETVNLGIAVDAPGGLVVPVIRNAETLDVRGIAAAVVNLASRAREGKLELDDLQGGTFTVSNPGAVGPSLRAEALLNPPQVALLGLPGLKKIPVVIQEDGVDTIAIRHVICPSLTFDHRALDGGEVVRYLMAVTSRVENWDLDDYLRPTASRTPSDQGTHS